MQNFLLKKLQKCRFLVPLQMQIQAILDLQKSQFPPIFQLNLVSSENIAKCVICICLLIELVTVRPILLRLRSINYVFQILQNLAICHCRCRFLLYVVDVEIWPFFVVECRKSEKKLQNLQKVRPPPTPPHITMHFFNISSLNIRPWGLV